MVCVTDTQKVCGTTNKPISIICMSFPQLSHIEKFLEKSVCGAYLNRWFGVSHKFDHFCGQMNSVCAMRLSWAYELLFCLFGNNSTFFHSTSNYFVMNLKFVIVMFHIIIYISVYSTQP